MTDVSTLATVGTDGIAPVYDPTARWCLWSIDEIYTGTQGKNRYVPKVKDYVVDPETYTTYIVTQIDPVTLIATLVEKTPANMSMSLSETDILFGTDDAVQTGTYRCYLDTSVTPHIMEVEHRLKIYGSTCNYAKIFKGTDCSETGIVLSCIYDSAGNFLTNNVPLELVALDSHDNYAIKAVMTCYTMQQLADGEIVTVVLYSADGHVVSKRQLLIENTAFIRVVNDFQKYITSISLDCPFLSKTSDTLIQMPLNVPIDALNLMGVVTYSDGSTLTLPCDGSKFTMMGIDQFLSTIISSKRDLVLSYRLSDDERTYGAVSSDGKYITKPYEIEVVNPNNAYNVKLFGYPVWINSATGYVMRWFLLNLDRNVWFDVTPYVKYAENTGTYNPKLYGYLQQKSVFLNLRDVSGGFKPYIHTQMVDINLLTEPAADTTPWKMTQSTGIDPVYGVGLIAKKQGGLNNLLKINCGLTDQTEWLKQVYLNTAPMIDLFKEVNPPTPTHFVLSYGATSVEYTLDQWDQMVNVGANIPDFGTIFIRFIKRTAQGDLQLSIAAMIVA